MKLMVPKRQRAHGCLGGVCGLVRLGECARRVCSGARLRVCAYIPTPQRERKQAGTAQGPT